MGYPPWASPRPWSLRCSPHFRKRVIVCRWGALHISANSLEQQIEACSNTESKTEDKISCISVQIQKSSPQPIPIPIPVSIPISIPVPIPIPIPAPIPVPVPIPLPIPVSIQITVPIPIQHEESPHSAWEAKSPGVPPVPQGKLGNRMSKQFYKLNINRRGRG